MIRPYHKSQPIRIRVLKILLAKKSVMKILPLYPPNTTFPSPDTYLFSFDNFLLILIYILKALWL